MAEDKGARAHRGAAVKEVTGWPETGLKPPSWCASARAKEHAVLLFLHRPPRLQGWYVLSTKQKERSILSSRPTTPVDHLVSQLRFNQKQSTEKLDFFASINNFMEYRQSHTCNPNFRKILISLKSSIYVKFIVKIFKQVFAINIQ